MNYAKYVGRVGALAVALGIGTAMAGPAYAEPQTAGAASNPPSESTVGSSPSPDDSIGRTLRVDDTANDLDGDDTRAAVGEGDAGEAPDEDGSDFVAGPDGDEDEYDDELADDVEDLVDDIDDLPDDDATLASDAVVVATPAAEGPAAAPATLPARDSSAPDPQPAGQVRVLKQAVPDDPRASNALVAADSVVAERVSSKMTGTEASTLVTGSVLSATAIAPPGVPAPAPLVQQPRSPIGVILGGPVALLKITAEAIGMLFSPGPITPGDPPLLLAVLAFARREIERTFFNSTPKAVADVATTLEDVPATVAVLANDTDANIDPQTGEGDVLTVTDYSQASHGTVVLNANGTFIYTPDADFSGTDSFSYTVSDESSPWHVHGLLGVLFGGRHTSTATVSITVNPVNEAPEAVDDVTAVDENSGTTTVEVLANDTDPEGDALIVTAVGTPDAGGTVSVNADGTISYTPAGDFSGAESFTYTISDGTSEDTATVTVTVAPVEDSDPVANDDALSTDEDTTLTIDPAQLLANDTGDDLVVTIVGTPANGNLVSNADGTYTYTPDENFYGTDTFTYVAANTATSNTATVTITVDEVNDAPQAADDAASVDEDTPVVIGVLNNDTDPNGDALTITAIGTPGNGTANLANGTITYIPDANWSGTDTFTYTVTDGTLTDLATVTVEVASVEDAPVVESVVVNQATSNSWRVTVTAYDPDGDVPDVSLTTDDPEHVTITLINPTPAPFARAATMFRAAVMFSVMAEPQTTWEFLVETDPEWALANPGAPIGAALSVGDATGPPITASLEVAVVTNAIGFGYNPQGQLDIPAAPEGVTYTKIAVGVDYTLALRSNGTVIVVGYDEENPITVPELPDGLTYTDIDAGYSHVVLLRSDGAAFASGFNLEGQTDIPELPDGLIYTAIGAGALNTVLVRSDNEVIVIGTDASEYSDIPELPDGLTYIDIAAGHYHALLMRSDGMVVGIGSNGEGQTDIPPLPDELTYTAMSAGEAHSVLLRSDGVAIGLGYDYFGQASIPEPPAGLTYTGVAAGGYHSVLLRSDGVAIAFGMDSSGQIDVPELPDGVEYVSVFAGVGGTVLLSAIEATD